LRDGESYRWLEGKERGVRDMGDEKSGMECEFKGKLFKISHK
jgi:hypothetical protein